MKYHILNEAGEKIASFAHNLDRDFCFEALMDEYPDVKMSTQDN